MNASFRVLTT